jgi:hypothetical protein
MWGIAGAFDYPTGNDDLTVTLDNTLRYSGAFRVTSQNPQLLKNPNTDDGDRNFSHGLVGNRFDWVPEFDMVYQKQYGIRVSADMWYDSAYSGTFDNVDTATSNHLVNGKPVAGALSKDAQRFYEGPDGELLDAFAFGHFDAGSMPLDVKIGRHTIFWGETLMLGGAVQGISYGQSPLDIIKGLEEPGASVNELFRPLNQVSFQVQPTSNLTVMGQYFFQWESARLPDAGTYLGFSDALSTYGESLIVGPNQRLLRGANSEPDMPSDNFGIGTRYKADPLDTTFGLYFRRFTDILPQTAVQPFVATLPYNVGKALGYIPLKKPSGPTAPVPFAFSASDITAIKSGIVGNYYDTYGKDIDLVGFSASREIFGVSVGGEVSYRSNMPLTSNGVKILPAPLAAVTPGAISYVPTGGETPGARGDTFHAVLSLLGQTAGTKLFDASSWMLEFPFSHLVSVTQNAAVFKSNSEGYFDVDAATRDYVGMGVSYTPTWYQVISGVDLTLPLSWSTGLYGNSCVTGGGNKDSGNFSVGVGFDYLTKYKLTITYINFYGRIGPDGTPDGLMTAGLNDRDMITLSFTTKF